MFPIGDDQVRGATKPLFSYVFIGINVLVFLFQYSLSLDRGIAFATEYGAIPVELVQGDDLYTIFTSMFMHASWMHLIGNMVFLWVFADNIEAVIGRAKFVIFYFLGGLAATAGHTFFNLYSTIPCVGASGAIAAVMGAYLIMFPTSSIRVWVFLFIVRIQAWLFLGFWIVQQGFKGIGSIGSLGDGVAWWAHIGGFVFGVIVGLLLQKTVADNFIRTSSGDYQTNYRSSSSSGSRYTK